MTVAELIEVLKEQDQNRVVILQRDSEGNGFSPLSGAWAGAYIAETAWSGDAGLDVLTDELREQGYTDEDLKGGEPALILVPVN